MSSRGEIVPELALLLRQIADRIAADSPGSDDAETLRRLAKHASGDDPNYKLKVHRSRRGQPPLGATGVDRRLAMARAVKAQLNDGGSLEQAYEALRGKFGNAGRDTLEDAWQEMRPLLEMSEEQRNTVLFFKRLEARGLATVTRTKRKD